MRELRDQLRPYLLRRMKEDVEKLIPPKEEVIVEVVAAQAPGARARAACSPDFAARADRPR